MKRLILALVLSTGLFAASYAQTTTPATTATTAKESKKASGTTKSGKPDMRFKANEEAAQHQADQPATTATTTTTPANPTVTTPVAKPKQVQPVVQNPNPNPAPVQRVTTTTQNVQPAKTVSKGTDAVAGTDAKGHTLYKGPRGGVYYINKNGNKEYVKQQ